ncbi:MAG: DUF928 domain-containing protein [Cyanothece sp. SIO1E1]|nr:DUF928 domain-containing protein [Cyanothece sp. SIO1E1]
MGWRIGQIVLATGIVALVVAMGGRFELGPGGSRSGAWAEASPGPVRWTPPRERGSVKSTLSGGRRGEMASTCSAANSANSTTLTLLVPQERAGLLTTSEQPTFFWHISTEQAIAVEFLLSHPDVAEPIYTQRHWVNRGGIVSLSLAADIELEVGTRYRWTILATCPEGTAQEIYARSFIERVHHESLEQNVPGQSRFGQAIAYAAAGIWYNALEAIIQAHQYEPHNAEVRAGLESLLGQAVVDRVGSEPWGEVPIFSQESHL